MIWRPFTSFLRNKASEDDAGGGGGGAATAAARATEQQPAEIEIPAGLADRMNPKQQTAYREMKKGRSATSAAAKSGAAVAAAKPAETPAAGTPTAPAAGAAAAAKPAETPAAGASEADGENVIDFGAAASGAAAAAGDEPQEPDTTGMDDATKAKVLDVHKENAKIRKRAQAAEKERDDLKGKHEEATKRLSEMESSPAGASGNLFAQFQNPRDVQTWVNDAQARINKILDKSVAGKTHKLPNGEEIDLAENEVESLMEAQQIMEHAGAWSEQRKTHGQSVEKAKAVVKRFEKVPEFARHHAEIAKQDPHSHWPQIVSRAAIGALVESGEWTLVKKSSAKAAAANSAAPNVSGAQTDTATPHKSAPIEVAGAQPPASRSDDAGGSVDIPSALKQRAMKGDQNAIREIVRLKTLRGSNRAAA